MKTREQLTEQIDQYVDLLIEKKETEKYNKVMELLGGEHSSDLDDLLEEATEEQLQSVGKMINPEINKTKRSDVLFIDPRIIKVEEGFNTRIDYGDIGELKSSIVENGVRVPMRGYKDGDTYVLTDGHRRFKAVNMALDEGIDIARVPFISENKKSLEERIFDILLFNDGKTLTSLELGETYKRLLNYGYNLTEIAKKIGKTVKHVSDMVKVACSTKELKKLVNDGVISATLVAEVKGKVKNDEEAEEILKTVSDIKKEESNGDKKKQKVTRKDVQDLIPEKEKSEVNIENQETFTKDEVIEFLKQQRKACASGQPLNIKLKILKTDLVLS